MSEKLALPVTMFFYPASAENSVLIYEQVISFALSWLNEKSISFNEKYLETIQDEELSWVSFTIELDKSLEEIAELNIQFAMQLADLLPPSLDNFIVKFIQVKPREGSNVTSK